ncbi:MAG: hypothetical protein QOJ65_639 [Fimbriimonadaceae bacterium]|jgi:hypothetical protein|nr:hypothetical protein [Fimbriimonadaceae bacterium]
MQAMKPEHLRAWWFSRQGLDNSSGQPAAAVLEHTGWARSVGGANPYLTLHARGVDSREEIDKALANKDIHELPSARGCTYVVPKAHYALALKVGQPSGDPQDVATAKKFLGVTEEEIRKLEEKVLGALEKQEQDPKQLKDAVGDAVRSLGDEGKKRGMTTTLPMALGRLQNDGRIRRVSTDGRLDNQRYRYAIWKPSPLDGNSLSQEQAFTELARLYFKWIGPASLANFQWFSGLGVKAAKAAVEPLNLGPIEAGSDLLMLQEDADAFRAFKAPADERIALIGSLDGLLHLRRDVANHVDEADQEQKMQGDKALYKLGFVQDLSSHGIVDRGRLIGIWEYDTDASEVAYRTFSPATAAVKKAVEKTQSFIRDQLGDARSFSLDSPQSRKPKIDFMRKG